MASAIARKSIRELTRHPVRSILTIITIAATVTGLWLFAVPLGLDDAVRQRAAIDRIHDIRLSPNNLIWTPSPEEAPPPSAAITREELAGIAAIANVAAVDARPVMWTEIRIDGEIQDTWLVGVEDFSRQEVDVVSVGEGTAPVMAEGGRQVLLEWTPRDPAAVGEEVELKAGDGEFYSFVVTGLGGTLRWDAASSDTGPVAYVPADMVRLFNAAQGFNSIELRLTDNNPDAARKTAADVRAYLDTVAPEMSYQRVPEIIEPGSWEGRDQVFRMLPLLYAVGFVALASALILVATTMNTIVSGQTSEIGVMKALGGSRRAIRRCYMQSVLLLGGIGTAVGTVAGMFMSDRFGRLTQEDLGGIRATWSVNPWFLIAAIAVGVGGTLLAALPALRRAMRISVTEALRSHGVSEAHGHGLLERITRRLGFLSIPAQLGLRNAARRKSRSLATSVQVALGVATVLAFGAFSVTALHVSQTTLENENADLRVYQESSLFDESEAALLAAQPDVAAIQPIVYGTADFGGDERGMWGLPAEPIYNYDLSAGRWFSPDEVAAAAPVAVIGEPLANMTRTEVGDRIEIGTKNGVETVEIVGIDENLVQDGRYIWVPISTAKRYQDQADPNAYWVETSSPDPDVVDRVAANTAAAFAAAENPVMIDVHHEDIAASQAEDRVVVGVIQVFGLPIVAIGMIGLVSAMTTAVLERTREIGVMRAIGGRAKHLRGVFRSEGTAIAIVGWLIGIPFGYALGEIILWLFGRALHTTFSLEFPLWLPFVVLAGTLVMARLTLRPPLRRAVRMQPGNALRYE